VRVVESNVGRISVMTGQLGAADSRVSYKYSFASCMYRTWRALGVRKYLCVCVCVCVCVCGGGEGECTVQLLLAVTCRYTRVAVVASNNTPTCFLALFLPPFLKSAPFILFNKSHANTPPPPI
jgi:hypothetical protein